MKEIPLTQGKVALVDDEDWEVLSAGFKWFARREKDTSYAIRNVRIPGVLHTTEKMHRVVLARKLGRPLAKGEEVDHKDGDGLDNRRDKLRLATHAQNMRNCRRHAASPSSRYLGVCWHRDRNKWVASIQISGKQVYLGIYITEVPPQKHARHISRNVPS